MGATVVCRYPKLSYTSVQVTRTLVHCLSRDNMNKLVLFSLCVLAVATSLDAAVTKFTTKYDNVNLDEILQNERLFKQYTDCILDKGKCTADGNELKNAIPEAMKNECGGCSEKQKEGAQKVIKYLHDSKPDVWEDVLNKYDPDGSYREKYKKESEKYLGKKE